MAPDLQLWLGSGTMSYREPDRLIGDSVVLTGEEWGQITDLLGLPAVGLDGKPPVQKAIYELRRCVGRYRRRVAGETTLEENRAMGIWHAAEHLRIALESLEGWKPPRPMKRRTR